MLTSLLTVLLAATSLTSTAGSARPTKSVPTKSVPTKSVLTTSVAASAVAPPPADSIRVTFDSPGSIPRAIRETVVVIAKPTKRLDMEIGKITYSGLACGFTFPGVRPGSPVTIEMTGSTRNGRFDSGPVTVKWTKTSAEQSDAGSAEDKKAKWIFVGAANTNRNGPGWVVSLTGISTDKSVRPLTTHCTIRSAAGFTPANGPVGYWSGFATA